VVTDVFKFKKKNSLRESGHYPKTFSKAIQYIQETQQDAETGLMVECFL
jgi:hypothetical protein